MLFHLGDLQFANNDMQFWAKPKAILMDKTIEVLELGTNTSRASSCYFTVQVFSLVVDWLIKVSLSFGIRHI